MSRTGRTPQKVLDAFIEGLEQGATITDACKAAGIGRMTAYDHRQRDEAFALRWADAIERGTEELETEARRRAMTGSDTLMIFLLKARRPDVYRERLSVDQRVTVNQPTAVELARLRRIGQRPDLEAAIEALAAGLAEDARTEAGDVA